MARVWLTRWNGGDPEDVARAATKQHIALDVAEKLGLETWISREDDCFDIAVEGSPDDILKFLDELAKPREYTYRFPEGIIGLTVDAESSQEAAQFKESGIEYVEDF